MATDLIRRLAVGLVLLSVMVSCRDRPDSSGAQPEARSTSLLPQERLELPEFDFPTYRALLRELRGTPVVVNIWGSWCPPCRVEAPDLARVSQEFEGKVQFLGVDILDDREAARDFILEYDWQYPSVFDPNGEIRDRLGYIGQPVTIIYDRTGEVAFDWVGALRADLLRREIRKVLEA